MRLDVGLHPTDGNPSTFASLDLGEPSGAYFDQGDLAPTGGNLYLYLDGMEVGSLFVYRDEDGTPRIMLGQFDPELQDWQERNNITTTTYDTTTKENNQ